MIQVLSLRTPPYFIPLYFVSPMTSSQKKITALLCRSLAGITGSAFSLTAVNLLTQRNIESPSNLIFNAIVLGTLSASCTTTKKAAACFDLTFIRQPLFNNSLSFLTKTEIKRNL